jgi:membrane protein
MEELGPFARVSEAFALEKLRQLPLRRWVQSVWHSARPTISYWLETETHVYGFAIAANVLLSFVSFMLLIGGVVSMFLGRQEAASALRLVISDFIGDGSAGDLIEAGILRMYWQQKGVSIFSAFLLLFTANGIFEPLEVGLNRAWGIQQNRSFWKNQTISLGLIFACGLLVFLSTLLTGINAEFLNQYFARDTFFFKFLTIFVLKLFAIPTTILMIFLIYWLLPNAKLPWILVVPPAIVVGLALELLKYLHMLINPWLFQKLSEEVGPFRHSVTVLLLSFAASQLILAGAEWSARFAREVAEEIT